MTRKQFSIWAGIRGPKTWIDSWDRTGADGKKHERIAFTYRPGHKRHGRAFTFDTDAREFWPRERLAIARCIAEIAGVEPPKE